MEALLKTTCPDLIVLEFISATPEVMSILERVRESEKLEYVPRLAILNRGHRDSVLLLARMGFTEIILKPVDIKQILMVLAF